MDAVWSVVLDGGLLGQFLDSGHLSMLDRINRRLRALHGDGGWRQTWKGWCKTVHSNEVNRMLRLASAEGKDKFVETMLQHVVAHYEKTLMQNLEKQCLIVSAEQGHVEVVKVLLEVGGRDLVMLTKDDGSSCLYISAHQGHVELVRMLLEVGGRDLAMLVTEDGRSCFDAAEHGGIGRAFEDTCTSAGMTQAEIAALKNK